VATDGSSLEELEGSRLGLSFDNQHFANLERGGVFFIGHVGGVDTWLGLLFSLIWLWRCYSMRLPLSFLDNSIGNINLNDFYTVSNVFHDLQTFTMRCLHQISMCSV
jgi:hypothetical protein